MKLLSKQEIARSKASERMQEVKEGMKLAGKVDKLRELSSQEEASLKKFREQSLANIREEIGREIERKEAAAREAEEAENRLLRLLNDKSLEDERNRLKERAKEQESIGIDQLKREIEVSKRENDLEDGKKAIFRRENELERSEKQADSLLREAEIARETAVEARDAAEKLRLETQKEKDEHDSIMRENNEAIAMKDRELRLREAGIESELEDITNQKRFLADQRATLERGFAELRRKQNK